jgi:hypothetical protein
MDCLARFICISKNDCFLLISKGHQSKITKEEFNMIKGLAITPPVLGRISIGKIVEKNGKRCLKRMTSSPLPAKSRIRMVG